MKIGIFTELYDPYIGGTETRYKQLSRELVNRGHKVNVYCINHLKSLDSYEDMNGVDVFRFPVAPNYDKPFLKFLKRELIPIFKYSFWTLKVTSQEEFDFILHAQWPLFHILFSSPSSRSYSAIDWCEFRYGKFYQLCQKFLPKIVGSNIAVSTSVSDYIEKTSGRPVFVLPSGIEKKKYTCLGHSKRSSLLFIGRIEEHKNLSLLIDAFKFLNDSGYTGRLIIVGDGSELEKLKSQVSSSKYSDFVDFLGFVSEDVKIRLLSEAELLVIPSKREGFPQVVAEAMASGLPVVTSNYPENGTTSVVSYYGCGLVSEQNAVSLYETILAALSNWENLSNEALRRSIELDWCSLVDTFEKQILMNAKT